jgi:AcrR family transcriptional regulator
MARIGGRRERIRGALAQAKADRTMSRADRMSARVERVRAKAVRAQANAADAVGNAERAQRRRRSPEEARVEILDAAERVFVEFQPDQVGLKEVAREAGVSHALITHYFGTYAGMIEAVLERRIRILRDRLLERMREADALSKPGEILQQLFRGLEDPVHLRLTKWLLASERPAAAHAFALRDHGLQLVAHQVASTLDPKATREQIGKIEIALLAAVASAYGYALGKYSLAGAVGRQVSTDLDREVLDTIGNMVEAHLRHELGIAMPPR